MKIFLDERLITFSAMPPAVTAPDEWIFRYESPRQLEAAFLQFEATPHFKALTVIDPDKNPDGPSPAEAAFMDLFKRIDAAGGLVTNEKGDLLFIQRLGRWDLPKGKMDKGETPLQTAVREIMEECNVHLNPDDCSFLEHTYHTYVLKEKKIFKRTHWFLCHHKHSDKLIPQTEENIEKVEWVNREQWNELKENSYPSIVQVVQKYLGNA